MVEIEKMLFSGIIQRSVDSVERTVSGYQRLFTSWQTWRSEKV
jgi:hypothetical protein